MGRSAGHWLHCVWAAALLVGTGRSIEADLDGFTNYNFRTSLVSSSASLAWVQTSRGIANLWFMAGSGTGWQLTQFTEPYMSITDVQISDSHSCVLFTRGPTAGANIASLASGTPKQQTWRVSSKASAWSLARAGAAVVIADAPFVGLSQNGSAVMYVSGDSAPQLIEASLLVQSEKVVLFQLQKGSISGLAWNPAGTSVAFVNDRGSHSFVGIFVRGTDRIRWVSPSADSDLAPAWSPSGRKLAWIRARAWPGAVGYSAMETDGMRGPRFSVMTARVDAASGRTTSGSTVYTDSTHGLPVQGFGRRPLVFANESSVLFPTEAISGWQHVAIVSEGGSAAEVRAGECQDFDWQIEQQTNGQVHWIYVAHNCDDLDSRSFERIRISDGYRESIASPKTDETIVAASASVSSWDARAGAPGGFGVTSDHVGWVQSSWSKPSVLYIAPIKHLSAALAVGSDPSPPANTVKPVRVVFRSADGLFMLHAQIFYPPTIGPSQKGVVFSHGGPPRQSFAAFHYDELYAQEYAVNQWLAATQNLTVLSVNYRLSDGYGSVFRNCEDCMHRGAAEYQDILQAGKVLLGRLTSHPPAHPVVKAGIWGLSYGGWNTIQAIARDSHTVWSAGVSHFGMFNWVSTNRYPAGAIRGNIEPVLQGGFRSLSTGPMPDAATPTWADTVAADNKLAFESSPASMASKMTAPLLLVASDADEDNSFEETIGAVRGMRRHGLEPELLIVPDEVHGLGLYENQVFAYEQTAAFFKKHLRS